MDKIRLIDTHAHLDFEDLSKNLDEIIKNCEINGIERVIIPGVTIKDTYKIIELIDKYDFLYGAVGLHPSDAKDWDDNSYETLKEYAKHDKVIAIGETGLDYYWDKTFNEQQQFVFKEHIRLSKELKLPLIVHDREAHGDVLKIIKETNAKEIGGVMHCFSGSAEFALECIKENFYIALGGPVTFKNAKQPKEVAKIIPIDKLVLETDSPFLAPQPFRGKTNDPSKVRLVAEEIADLRGITLKELSESTFNNSIKLFFSN
ncbi:MAG: TatD family hydrolase [bacterium]